jgi:hypothetical protein
MFGPFSAVYDETENTETIFEKSFIQDDLISSLFGGGSRVIFGFGFSGSGKTFQLIYNNTIEEVKTDSNTYLEKTIDKLENKKYINLIITSIKTIFF